MFDLRRGFSTFLFIFGALSLCFIIYIYYIQHWGEHEYMIGGLWLLPIPIGTIVAACFIEPR